MRTALKEPFWVRASLIAGVVLVLGLLIIAPLVAVFAEAFSKGAGVFWQALSDDDALSAITLTITPLRHRGAAQCGVRG